MMFGLEIIEGTVIQESTNHMMLTKIFKNSLTIAILIWADMICLIKFNLLLKKLREKILLILGTPKEQHKCFLLLLKIN